MPEGYEIEIISHTTPATWTGGTYTTSDPLGDSITESLDAFIDSELERGSVNPDRLIIVVTPRS
jgi:hypothetical protein